jgi:hypothetical protein
MVVNVVPSACSLVESSRHSVTWSSGGSVGSGPASAAADGGRVDAAHHQRGDLRVPVCLARSITGRTSSGSSASAAPYSDSRSPCARKLSVYRSVRSPMPFAGLEHRDHLRHPEAGVLDVGDGHRRLRELGEVRAAPRPTGGTRRGGSLRAAARSPPGRARAAAPPPRCRPHAGATPPRARARLGRWGSPATSSRSVSRRRVPRPAMART